jgi:hypothetical protein
VGERVSPDAVGDMVGLEVGVGVGLGEGAAVGDCVSVTFSSQLCSVLRLPYLAGSGLESTAWRYPAAHTQLEEVHVPPPPHESSTHTTVSCAQLAPLQPSWHWHWPSRQSPCDWWWTTAVSVLLVVWVGPALQLAVHR